MCGICGRILSERGPVVETALIERMSRTLRHRGPDDEGWITGPGFGLGHTRLSIIDLSDAARQPLITRDERYLLVFNGEIYNFLELKAELEAKGHTFRSRTDGEVILHLYEEEREACLDHLRGMFAFALYDREDHILFVARDRLGKKPLVYALRDGAFTFASEIKALLADPAFPREPDLEAIHHYLSYQYVPAPWTAFKGIRKLPPAHYLIFREGELTIKPYWRLSFADPMPLRGARAEDELCERLRDKLDEAVRLRMVSDVPVGAFLSGGVDSAAVVALMRRHARGKVKTFTIGFEERIYDESAEARDLSNRLDTEHTDLVVSPDAAAMLPKMVWHYGEPFADASGVPSFHLAELAARDVKVVLNGDGGDENFGGYNRYRAHVAAERLSWIPGPLRKGMLKALEALLPRKAGSGQGFAWQFRRFLRQASTRREERNFRWFCYIDSELKSELYTEEFLRTTRPWPAQALMGDAYRSSDARDFIGKTLHTDLRTYLPYDLLVKMDIASMAHSLEARSPFLDHELVELAARIPSSVKVRGMKIEVHPEEGVVRRGAQGGAEPAQARLRRAHRHLAQGGSEGDGERPLARAACRRAGVLRTGHDQAPFRGALVPKRESSPPALGPAHARALVPAVHRSRRGGGKIAPVTVFPPDPVPGPGPPTSGRGPGVPARRAPSRPRPVASLPPVPRFGAARPRRFSSWAPGYSRPCRYSRNVPPGSPPRRREAGPRPRRSGSGTLFPAKAIA